MAEREAKKHETDGARHARVVAEDSLEQRLQSASFGLEQLNNRVSQLDGFAPLGNPGFQAAQRSQYVVSLQRRHGNRYVQRVIERESSGLAKRPVVHIVPRAELAGTIARWPPDNPADIPRLLAEARERLENRVIIRIPLVSAQLSEPGAASETLLEISRSLDRWYYDLPDEIAARIDDAGEVIAQAYVAVQAVFTGGRTLNERLMEAISTARSEGRFIFSSAEGLLGRWETEVVGRIRSAYTSIVGTEPDYRAAYETCEGAVIMARRLPLDVEIGGGRLSEEQSAAVEQVRRDLERVLSALRVFMLGPPSVATPVEQATEGMSGDYLRFLLELGLEYSHYAVIMIDRMLAERPGEGSARPSAGGEAMEFTPEETGL